MEWMGLHIPKPANILFPISIEPPRFVISPLLLFRSRLPQCTSGLIHFGAFGWTKIIFSKSSIYTTAQQGQKNALKCTWTFSHYFLSSKAAGYINRLCSLHGPSGHWTLLYVGPAALKGLNNKNKFCNSKELWICNGAKKALKCAQTFSHHFFILYVARNAD